MRLFLTINMDQIIREELAEELPVIKEQFNGKFVPKENWHVTMLFLGEVEDRFLPKIEAAMESAVESSLPFQLYLEGVGAFPSKNKPNILWIGLKGKLVPLQELYQRLLQEISKIGVSFDAKPKFTPHLTLARKVEVINNNDAFTSINVKTSSWEVNALQLYESKLTPSGAQYKIILNKKFGKKE